MLQRTPNLQQRTAELLNRINAARAKRDEQVANARRVIQGDDTAEQNLDFLNDAARVRCVSLVDQAVVVSGDVQLSARSAEAAIRDVKRLDRLAAHVHEALEIVEGIVQQQHSVAGVSQSLSAGDFKKATDLIVAFEAAARRCRELPREVMSPKRAVAARRAKLRVENGDEAIEDEYDFAAAETDPRDEDNDGGEDGATTSTGTGSGSSSAQIIATAKADLLARLRAEIVGAKDKDASHKPRLLETCIMLAALGEDVEAYTGYCGWVATRATAEIKDMVAKELSAMGDKSARHSHLNLVSAVLDHVVATMEREEDGVVAAFGPRGIQALLLQLHHECTRSSVEVLKNFLSKRVASGSGPSSSSGASKSSDGGRRGGHASSSPSTLAGGAAQEPRVLDQTLEEISHLVSCCHLYMGFMEDKFKSSEDAIHAASTGATPKQRGNQPLHNHHQHYSLAMTKGNALFDMIQELLAIYIPLQNDFFTAAFAAAVEQEKASAPPLTTAGADGSANGGSSGGGGLIGTFSSLYRSPSAASTSSPAGGHTSGQSFLDSLNGDDDDELERRRREVALVDDVFYFLRVALHRAVETKNRPIVSAVIISINNVIRDNLVPFVEEQYAITKRDGAAVDTIRWVNALYQCKTYTEKFAGELVRLTDAAFHGDERIQFREQHQDFIATAAATDKKLAKVLQLLATNVTNALYQAAGLPEAFAKSNYILGAGDDGPAGAAAASVIGGAGGAAGDGGLPWLAFALQQWSPILDEVKRYALEQVAADAISRVIGLVVQGIEAAATSKQYDAYGALQFDRDVRAMRSFFSERCDAPVREKFGSLVTLAAILTSSSLAEAEEAAAAGAAVSIPPVASTGRTQQQQQAPAVNVARLIKLRVDFGH